MRRPIRKLRHWKQRFDKNASFIFRRPTTYGGEKYEAGDAIPESLEKNPTKIRRFWESKRIELAEFDAPNVASGQIDFKLVQPSELPEGYRVSREQDELGDIVFVLMYDDACLEFSTEERLFDYLVELAELRAVEEPDEDEESDEDEAAESEENTDGEGSPDTSNSQGPEQADGESGSQADAGYDS